MDAFDRARTREPSNQAALDRKATAVGEEDMSQRK